MKNSQMNDEAEEVVGIFKKYMYWWIGVLIMLSIGAWFATRTANVIDNGIVHYEEFQELYNTCAKINTDLCNIKDVPETDKMFEQFSKAQRINALQTNLNRWVQDYNAKSKMINRSLWKSSELPQQLETNQFKCYQN